MANPVFANSMEISSKSMGGKSICQFPDVCFTPPQSPATPPGVPVPYPNTGLASDTSDGSRTVKIGGEEVMLKDRSFFKKSAGDEAGVAPKKGFVNSKVKGRVYFISWSMDVKFEGENVVRNLDMTTHNHACSPANGSVPAVHLASVCPGFASTDSCAGDRKKVGESCDGKDPCPGVLKRPVEDLKNQMRAKTPGLDVEKFASLIDKRRSRTSSAAAVATQEAESSDCVKAMRCALRPYNPSKGKAGCCPGQTPHHIPPKSMMMGVVGEYSKDAALCVCLEGMSQHVGSHGENHAALDHVASKPGVLDGTGHCTVSQYNKVCAQAVAAQCGCDSQCIEDQLNGSFTEAQRNTKVKHYQSNSKQLSADVKGKLDKAFDSVKASGQSE